MSTENVQARVRVNATYRVAIKVGVGLVSAPELAG
jgi:NH3-dependent NAD+ synthetase